MLCFYENNKEKQYVCGPKIVTNVVFLNCLITRESQVENYVACDIFPLHERYISSPIIFNPTYA